MATSHNAAPMLRVAPAPHWTSPLTRRHINLAILIGLAPAMIAATWTFGWSALARIGLAAGAAILVELLTQRVMRQPERVADLSAVIQGVMFAFLLPPTAPWWLILIGVVVMIVLGKQLFGGVGGYPINPVLLAWAVLLLSWTNRIHPVGELGLLGTAWIPAVWMGGVTLVVLGHLKWQAPLGMLAGVVFTAFGLGTVFPEIGTPASQLATGSVVFGAFFLSTDTTCSPANPWPRLVFGLCAGVLVVLLRLWGTWPEPVPFALLLMNLAAPLFDKIRPTSLPKVTSHA